MPERRRPWTGSPSEGPFAHRGTRRLRYVDVERFTYAATRQYVNVLYAGTLFLLCFEPRGGGRPVRHAANRCAVDDELERLREHVSSVIAARMAEELAAGRSVAWTRRSASPPTAASTARGASSGRSRRSRTPGARWRARGGRAIREVSAPNFFPGLALLSSMVQGDGADGAA